MFDTKVIVAPNSPKALAKHSTAPTRTPGIASGSVTLAKTRAGPAPSVPAACSSRRSMASIDSRTARTINGKPITALASAAPVHRNAKTTPR